MSNRKGVIVIEGHVQGLSNTRALGENNVPVIVIDRLNCIARYSKYCKDFFFCPDYQSEEFVPFLIELSIKRGLRGWLLLPSNDHAVISISKERRRLEEYYTMYSPENKTLELIYDKSELMTFASKLKIPVPVTSISGVSNKGELSKLPFPVLTKGKYGLSFYRTFGKKAFVANNIKELDDQFKFISKKYDPANTFTQELIPYSKMSRIISFTAYCENGEIKAYWIGEKIREHPIRYGTATLAESIECKELLKPSKKLLIELGYSGICEIEYVFDPRDKKFKLIEINARTWLWVGLARACGVNYPLLIYNKVNNIENDFPLDYIKGIAWINYLSDSLFAILALIRGKLNFLEYLRSFKGKKINAVFSWHDILPGIMLVFLSFNIIYRRKRRLN